MNKTVKLSSMEKPVPFLSPLMGTGKRAPAMPHMEAATLMTLPARHMLFREGEAAEHLYFVLAGYVRLFRTSKDGREADMRICGPGEAFNDCLIFGADSNRYNAQTAEGCTLARLELGKIRTMIETDSSVAISIIQYLCNNTRAAMDSVANDRLQTAPQRVAHYLVTQAPNDNGPYSLRLPFQKSVLAGKLGLAPEALSRAFSSLRECGVIVRGRTIYINDPAALKHV